METTQNATKVAFGIVGNEWNEKDQELIDAIDHLTNKIGITDQKKKASVYVKRKSFCANFTVAMAQADRDAERLENGE